MKLLKEKKVDMIMVHAPAAERKATAEGWTTLNKLIGSSEFYIVGPPEDPAKISDAKSAVDAYKRIAFTKSKFFSGGDKPGTHKKEMDVWEKTGIIPSGDWHFVTKDFMATTLKRADAEKEYFMTGSSTWVAERKNMPNLPILFRGDKFLINTKTPRAKSTGVTPGSSIAAKFIDFAVSEKGQKLIRGFG